METEWIFPEIDETKRRSLSEKAGISQFLADLLLRRGMEDPDGVRKFLKAPIADLPLPHEMKDLMKGIDLVCDQIEREKTLAIYGDYDVDGICATATLAHFLTRLGCRVQTFLASRFDYGYGLGLRQAEAIVRSGAGCAILVDCGTADLEATAYLEAKGIKTLVIDHHRVGPELPPVSAFINPMRPDCPFPYKAFTASALSFYFVATMKNHKSLAKIPAGLKAAQIDPREYLDLAAIGTVADVAPVTGANRNLLKGGLKRMKASSRPALIRVLAAVGAAKRMRGEEIVSYYISPLLNAAGRMGDPALALKFLLAADEAEARPIHEEISRLNTKRKEEERRAVGEARFMMSKIDLERRSSIVLFREGWHPGVLGIVASRLVDRTGRPVAVISTEGKVGRGSIRAPAGINIFSPLECHREIFERFGGHSSAIGFTIKTSRIKEFEQRLEEACSSLLEKKMSLLVDATMHARELEWFHLMEIEKLSPFGMENPTPLLCFENVAVQGCRIVGSNHLKFFVSAGDKTISVFGPGMGERLGSIASGISLVGHVRADTFRGGEALEPLLKDFK